MTVTTNRRRKGHAETRMKGSDVSPGTGGSTLVGCSLRIRIERSHSMLKHSIAAISGLVTLLLVAGVASAAKPSSSLNLVVVDSISATAATSSTPTPSFGQQITFEVATTETDRPFVNVRFYQNGAFVYDGWNGFFASYVPEPTFTLSAPGYWEGGAADCTARLVAWDRNSRLKTLATMSFQVSA
jgi:hypothetical protein